MDVPLLTATGLTKRYGAQTLFEHLSLTLHRGRCSRSWVNPAAASPRC
ncbi:hypothetical protein ACQ86G_26090 [Roseateles chitinivorans]